MSAFKWCAKSRKAAELLAEGYSFKEASRGAGVTDRTLRRWRADTTFAGEVDKLSLAVGVATSAARLRIINKLVRQRIQLDDLGEEEIISKKDVLDWLKLAHDETTNQAPIMTINIVGFESALEKIYGDEPKEP